MDEMQLFFLPQAFLVHCSFTLNLQWCVWKLGGGTVLKGKERKRVCDTVTVTKDTRWYSRQLRDRARVLRRDRERQKCKETKKRYSAAAPDRNKQDSEEVSVGKRHSEPDSVQHDSLIFVSVRRTLTKTGPTSRVMGCVP